MQLLNLVFYYVSPMLSRQTSSLDKYLVVVCGAENRKIPSIIIMRKITLFVK